MQKLIYSLCVAGAAQINMVKNENNLTCNLEGVNGEAPTNLIFSYEMTYKDNMVFDPEFCKKSCVGQLQSSWDETLGGSLCCTFID